MAASVTQDQANEPLDHKGPATGEPLESGWSRTWVTSAAFLAVGLAALIGLYWETASETVRVWYVSETFNHCFLIFPISGWLVWRRLDRLKALEPSPWLPAVVPLALGSLLWLVGDTAGILVIEQVALIGMAYALVLAVLGWAVVWALLFPLFFWIFAVPIGTELIPFFQHVTAQFIVPLLRFTGIPVYLEGLYLYIPSGSFEVAEACSGVRYLISTVTLGFLAAHILFQSTTRRIIFVLLSLAIPIFANGLRAYGIVMIAHLSDYKYAVGADHLVYGWIFFSFVTFCLLGVGMAMRGKEDKEEPAPFVAAGPTVRSTRGPTQSAAVFVVALVAASLGLFYKGYLESGIPEAAAAPPLALAVSDSWTEVSGPAPNWQPLLPGRDGRGAPWLRGLLGARRSLHRRLRLSAPGCRGGECGQSALRRGRDLASHVERWPAGTAGRSDPRGSADGRPVEGRPTRALVLVLGSTGSSPRAATKRSCWRSKASS